MVYNYLSETHPAPLPREYFSLALSTGNHTIASIHGYGHFSSLMKTDIFGSFHCTEYFLASVDPLLMKRRLFNDIHCSFKSSCEF